MSRSFTVADQTWFRTVSGDANPLHMDPHWAAATFPGAMVVHGMHALFWGLEQALRRQSNPSPASLRATFVRPILVGDEVSAETSPDGLTLRLLVQGEPMLVAHLGPDGPPPTPSVLSTPPTPADRPVRDRRLEDLPGLAGQVACPDIAALSIAFPVMAQAFGPVMLAGLAALSTLVGMECPGRHALFSEFSVTRAQSPLMPELSYGVKRINKVFSRVEMTVEGLGLTGLVSAFVGRDDVPPSDETIRATVTPDEFQRSTPLIIGGSGGLGAITARLLAAGGAEPVVTWHRSQEGGLTTRAAIERLGGRCRLLRMDASAPGEALGRLTAEGWQGNEVYYFATPRIFRRHLAPFDAADLRAFLDIYVDSFYELVHALVKTRPDTPWRIFYPSTVAVGEKGRDLLEYGMAKEAGERLCSHLAERYRNLSITVERLPRIATRQTQSFVRVKAESPEQVMLPIIRRLQDRS